MGRVAYLNMRLINADRLKRIAETLTIPCLDKDTTQVVINLIKEMVDNTPTAKANIVKRGKWIDKEIYPGLLHTACSECGTLCNDYMCEQVLTNYCPECGAKLK